MTNQEVRRILHKAEKESDLGKRQSLIDSIPKIVAPYYTIQNGVITKSRRVIQYRLDKDGEIRQCFNDISQLPYADIGKLLL